MKKNLLLNPTVVVCLAIFCNVLWGSAYPGVKLGYEAFGITTVYQQILFAGVRFAVAGLIVFLISFIKDKKIPVPSRGNFGLILWVAVIYTAVQYPFFYVGLSNTSGTNGSIFNSTTTFIAVILAHFVYKNDKLNARKIIGTIIGFVGVLSVTIGGAKPISFLGEGCIILAALTFVCGSMLSKKATKVDDAFVVTAYNMIIGGIILIILGLCGGGRFETISWSGIIGLAYLCLLSVGTYTIWTSLLQHNPVGKISVYNFIIPVSASILSAVFLNENIFELRYLISLILVCLGIIIVNKPKKTK